MIRFLKYLIKNHWQEYNTYRELKMRFPESQFEKNILIKGPLDNLKLGRNVTIQSNVVLHLGGMDWCQNKGFLKIGDNSIISPGVLIYAAGPEGVDIGLNFGCGPGVKIFASRSSFNDKDKLVFGKVSIGNNVILFANVIVSPGVSIGDNAVVLGGSLVNKDIPTNTIFGGIPARMIKSSI